MITKLKSNSNSNRHSTSRSREVWGQGWGSCLVAMKLSSSKFRVLGFEVFRTSGPGCLGYTVPPETPKPLN